MSPLGQAALRAAWGLPDVAIARFVAASRHGEYARTLSILDSLVAGDGVSPSEFTLSVHHALIGLLSIATRNRHGHTAIGAGPDSFGFGLMEAAACLVERPDQPVVFLYYDERLPAPFDDFSPADEQPLAIALSLAANGGGDTIAFETSKADGGEQTESFLALDFLRFMLSGERAATSRGPRVTWQWRRHASAA